MTTISIVIENQKDENDYLIDDKSTSSIHLLNKKRYKSDDEYIETNTKFKKEKKISFFSFNKIDKLEIFLSNFEKIIKDKEESFQKEKKRYVETNFNLSLVNSVINYFSIMKFCLGNISVFTPKELIELIKTFCLNELEFSVLTILIEEFLSKFLFIFDKENIYYLGLYSKYISTDSYKDIFIQMLNEDPYFKDWYYLYKEFLESLDLSLLKINKRNNCFSKKEQKMEIFDHNLMVDDIFEIKKEIQNKKIFTQKYISHNIGKKVNVVIVYQDKTWQNIQDKNQMDKTENSNNDMEGLQTDISA
jgi:hypothetical protein